MLVVSITLTLSHRNMRALEEVGYEHMLVPDHPPGDKDPKSGRQASAYEFGYITAMIQAVIDDHGFV